MSRTTGETKSIFRRLLPYREAMAQTDGQLLERYLQRRDEQAFAALVERYGSLVLGVCERVLQDKHAAEDAFQATFLVLVRQAKSLDRSGPLGNWLYTVAYRTAQKARIHAARRRDQERQAADMREPPNVEEALWFDVRPILDEELDRLPEKYRAPLVLCCLEGKTHEQAARELGWPSGSMSRRLSKARELLRDRLTRRGVLLSSGLLFGLMTGKAKGAAVPALLVSSTAKAAVLFAAGTAAEAGTVASQPLVLAHEMLQSMGRPVLPAGRRLITVLGLLGVIGLSTGFATQSVIAEIRRHWDVAGCGSREVAEPAVEVRWRLLDRVDGIAPSISTVAMSADGRRLAGGMSTGRIRLWDLSHESDLTKAPVRDCPGPSVAIHALAFSPDGATLAAAHHDGSVWLWEVATARVFQNLPAHVGPTRAVAFSPDGSWLASGGADGTVRLWNLAKKIQHLRLSASAQPVNAVAFAPDGRQIFAGTSNGMVTGWATDTGTETVTWQAHVEPIQALAISGDGRHLATGSLDRSIKTWDLRTGGHRATFTGHTAAVTGLGFGPDPGMLVSVGPDGTVRLWHLDVAQKGEILQAFGAPLAGPAWAAEQPTLALASSDGRLCRLELQRR